MLPVSPDIPTPRHIWVTISLGHSPSLFLPVCLCLHVSPSVSTAPSLPSFYCFISALLPLTSFSNGPSFLHFSFILYLPLAESSYLACFWVLDPRSLSLLYLALSFSFLCPLVLVSSETLCSPGFWPAGSDVGRWLQMC